MEVILKKDIEGLGRYGDLKIVKDGFARNHLVPQGLAVMANERAKKDIEKEREKYEKERDIKLEEAVKNKEILEKIELTFKVKSLEGKIFGSITNRDVADKLTEESKINIEKKDVEFEAAHNAGNYKANIKIAPGVKAEVKVTVKEEEQVNG